jgi:hypothetical protein
MSPVSAIEESRGTVTEIGGGVYLISLNDIYKYHTSSPNKLYVAQSISKIIVEHPELEYVSLTSHNVDYGATDGYIVIFRTKNLGNCTY